MESARAGLSGSRSDGGFGRQAIEETGVQIYLPIAEMPVGVLLILAVGAAVGFISGLFGIGGGFLMTPLLIFLGIPPAVAVAAYQRDHNVQATGVLDPATLQGLSVYTR